jgi:hypothetical protein
MLACRISLSCNDRCIWKNGLAVMLRRVFLRPPTPLCRPTQGAVTPHTLPRCWHLSRCSLNRGGETMLIGTKATGHCWPPGGGAGGCVPFPWGQEVLPSLRNIILYAKQSDNSFSRRFYYPDYKSHPAEMSSLPVTAPRKTSYAKNLANKGGT